MEDADLILVLKDSQDPEPFPALAGGSPRVSVLTKADLVKDGHDAMDSLQLSVKTGEGFDSLTKRILQIVEERTQSAPGLTPVRLRQVAHLTEAIEKIEETVSDLNAPLELRAESLRRAA